MKRSQFFCVIVALLSSVGGAKHKSTQPKNNATRSACHPPRGFDKAFSAAADPFTADGNGSRYVAANHKTGTFFAQCLCGALMNPNGTASATSCKAGGFPFGANKGMQHSRGIGITADAFCINVVRNPFVMVHSGMEYHNTTDNRHEVWLHWPVARERHEKLNRGLIAAATSYNKLCWPERHGITTSRSYQHNLKALPFDEALVLEALRALSTDMANMIVAARRCAQVEVEAAATVPRVGGCQNLLLDDLTSDLVTGFTSLIAPALRVPPAIAPEFFSQCDPSGVNAMRHATVHGQARVDAITRLRELDLLYLGGALHTAETAINLLLGQRANPSAEL